MLDFPQELIDRISDSLVTADLQQTLTVSRQFQYAAERASGAYEKFELTEINAGRFLQLYDGRRIRYLRHVTFRTDLPRYGRSEEEWLAIMRGPNWVEPDWKKEYELLNEREEARMRREADKQADEEASNSESTPDAEDQEEPLPDWVYSEEGEREYEEYQASPQRCRESVAELQENDHLFTDQIQFLFKTLRTLEDAAGIGSFGLTVYVPERENYGCFHRKFSSWRLHLLSPNSLPELSSVRSLTLKPVNPYIEPLNHDPTSSEENKSIPKADLRMLGDLVLKLPQIQTLACELGYHEWASSVWSGIDDVYGNNAWRSYSRDFPGPKRDSRHDFAKLMSIAVLPATLQNVRLNFLTPRMQVLQANQDEQLPDLTTPHSYDPFSSSLRIVSYNLRRMELEGIFDKTLFLPIDGSRPAWPSLESLNVYFHISAPSGQWYFYGPNGEGRNDTGFQITEALYPPLENTDEDNTLDEYIEDSPPRRDGHSQLQFRVIPNEELLGPFLTAFAKAAAHMQKLKEAVLWTQLAFDGCDLNDNYRSGFEYNGRTFRILNCWGIGYISPTANASAERILPAQRVCCEPQLLWQTNGWRPDETLQKLFRSIGGEGAQIDEHWDQEFLNRLPDGS